MKEAEITLRAVGPATDGGRLPLAEIARISSEFQAAIERIAQVLVGESASIGRRRKEIVDAVRLDLTGFSAGSAVLKMSSSSEAILPHSLLRQSMDSLFDGLRRIASSSSDLPETFSPQVLDGLIRLAGGISPRTVKYIELNWRNAGSVRLDEEFRRSVRSIRRQVHHDEVVIVGRLHEGDFSPLALRCRIDTISNSVPCTFDQALRDQVLRAMDSMVTVTGVAEFSPDGTIIRSLDLLTIEVIDEAVRRDLSQLANEQGVQPVMDISQLAAFADSSEEEYEQFVRDALSAR